MQPGLFLLHLSMPGPTPEGLHVSNPVCYTLGHLGNLSLLIVALVSWGRSRESGDRFPVFDSMAAGIFYPLVAFFLETIIASSIDH